MAFTSIEVIALILIALATVKIITLLVKPQAWMHFADWVYSNPRLTQLVGTILAVVALYYLLQEMTIVQIFAASAFFSLLIMIGLAPYGEWFVKKYENYIKKKRIWKENWFYTLIWILLMTWTLKVIFS